ncbi:nucleolar protein 7 isoform X2 [Megalobrama amblycephala]|uniref:nucleolar protein 7 isoform X2 n=1 Tax=Megalobrama amblycephala TaxID=75352 RepID=UPI0020143C1C|nr:nucleolar protein 7 isoform X2 [Megalobrama amblycephala]
MILSGAIIINSAICISLFTSRYCRDIRTTRWQQLLQPILVTLVCLSLMYVQRCWRLIWRFPSSVCTKIRFTTLKETDNMSELTQAEFESSDDELPEEVGFDASKSAALKSVKDALESAKREKNLLKEKRRKRQQLYQEQKSRKRLPEDLLEEFDTEPQKQTELSENEKDGETKTTSKTNSKSLPDSYSVKRVKDETAAKSLQQSAMDFIQSRLYGPGTKRTTNAEILSLKRKRGANQGAAVEFASKKLGADVKAKVAKSNKRFLQKRKLVPS